MSGERPQGIPQAEPPREREVRRLWPLARTLLRTRIVAGLLTVVPIWVTYFVVKFLFDRIRPVMDLLTKPVAEMLVDYNKNLLPGEAEKYSGYIVLAVSIVLMLFLLYLLGLFSANVFGARFLLWLDGIFGKLPLVKTIYSSTKQIVVTVGGGQSTYFQRVVLVEYPRPGMKVIGFLTSVTTDADTGRKIAAIFIASTPTCSTGYMQLVPLEEVSETGWTVEQAVKAVMSGGLVMPSEVPFDRVHPVKTTVHEVPGDGPKALPDRAKPQSRAGV